MIIYFSNKLIYFIQLIIVAVRHKMLTSLCMILFLNLLKLGVCEEETIIVNLSQGQLRGKVATTFRGLDYYSFQGVPYANPPIGELRFKVNCYMFCRLPPVI